MKDYWAIDVKKGGNAIPYHEEDPFLRREFEATLGRAGLIARMDPKLYEPPASEAA
jgi:hypothetical protein